jgi:hypothetical protein
VGDEGPESGEHVKANSPESGDALQIALQIALADPERRGALLEILGLAHRGR